MSMYPVVSMLIDGEWRVRDGADIVNPADESIIGTVPHATTADLDDALSAAERGFAVWRRTSPAERSRIMHRAAAFLRERIESIARTLTIEQGKPLAESRNEVLRSADIIEWDAEEGRRASGRVIPTEAGIRNVVLRQPIGVVAAFSPWNAPVLSPTRKVAGALAAGCSVILKASEETPAGAMLLAQAFADAGVPAGVINLVFGIPADIATHLIASPVVRLVTFTGSIPVGKQLTALAGRHMKPVIMELGGHSPVFVCDDADAESSAQSIVQAKSRNAGQVCVAPTRIFVQPRLYDQFEKAFVAQAEAIRVGNGLDPDTRMGPLANSRRVAAMEHLVADAVRRGARVLAGGNRMRSIGYHYPVTTLADVPEDAEVMREEPFGPLAILCRTPDLSSAIASANSLPYGLSGYAFTDSAATIERLSDEVEVGTLSINHMVASTAETPFGGVKDSGLGREGGTEGLACYTVTKNISHRIARP